MSEDRIDDCNNDILDVLSVRDYPRVMNLLKNDWPSHRILYYWVEEAIRWKKKDPNLLINIYYPRGKIESEIFIGISDLSYQFVVFLSFGGNSDLLKEVCMQTQRISWQNKNFQIPGLVPSLFTPVNSVLTEMQHLQKGPIFGYYPYNTWVKPATDCLKEEIIVPDDCYLSEITEDHVDFIHSHWPHRRLHHPEITLGALTTRIKMNKGVGLFSKSDHELMAWILISEFGTLSVLHTVEEHRRKGYAEVVTKQMAKEVARDTNHDSIATVVPGNKTSENLFKKLHYTLHQTVDWISTPDTN